MSSWQAPVVNYTGPPLPDPRDAGVSPVGNMDQNSTPSENFWASIFPWMFPGQNLRPTPPMQKGNPAPLPQTAPTDAADAARKALGINPADWQTFIRQTGADWGVYVGLGVLGLIGLVFLVSAGGGGSPPVVIQNVKKKVSGTA